MNAPKTVPPASIALSFFAAALATLGVTLTWVVAGTPSALAVLHLLVLGVFAMVAMGALYQFVPVVGMAPLASARLPFAHLALALFGTAAVAYGFQSGRFAYVAAGGALHVAGALLEAGVLVATLWKRANAGMPARLATLAFGWFVATAAAGIAVSHGSLAPGVHGVIGLAGFFGTLVAAVTFRLLRMFERINVEPRAPLRVLAAGGAAIVAAVAPRAGSIVLAVVAALLVVDLADIARRRNPAYQRETLLYAFTSMAGGLLAALAMWVERWETAIVLAVWYFVGAAVAGHIQRIVPFIWWMRRARLEGARNIPNLAQVNSSPLGVAILILWIAAGAVWIAGPFSALAAILALAAWLGLVVQLSRPFWMRTPAR